MAWGFPHSLAAAEGSLGFTQIVSVVGDILGFSPSPAMADGTGSFSFSH